MALTKSDLQAIKQIISIKVDPLAKDVSDIKKRVRKIESNIELMANFFDQQDSKLSKRVSKIEKHLGLPQN